MARFDADASASGLDREQALRRHAQSSDGFFRDRGRSTRELIARLETLSEHAEQLGRQPDYLDPLTLVTAADQRVLAGARRDYQPAVPLTASSLAWAGAGFLLGGFVVMLVARIGGGATRMAKRRFGRQPSGPALR